MRTTWNAVGAAVLGLAVSIGPALIALAFTKAAPFERFGVVVLGGLIAMRACRRTL